MALDDRNFISSGNSFSSGLCHPAEKENHAILTRSTTLHSNAALAVINNRGIANTLQSPFIEIYIYLHVTFDSLVHVNASARFISLSFFLAIERIISRDCVVDEELASDSGVIYKFV